MKKEDEALSGGDKVRVELAKYAFRTKHNSMHADGCCDMKTLSLRHPEEGTGLGTVSINQAHYEQSP